MLRGQLVLIDLGSHALEYCDKVPERLRGDYYELLGTILERGEFELNHMGFDSKFKELLQEAKVTEFKSAFFRDSQVSSFQEKLRVAWSYQSFTYRCLEMVIKKLEKESTLEEETSLIYKFLARAYFKIPSFREKILTALVKEEDIAIEEWRGTEFHLDSSTRKIKMTGGVSCFEWEKDFNVYLGSSPKGEENKMILEMILRSEMWVSKLARRRIEYFRFLKEWCTYVYSFFTLKEHVPWQEIPGFRTLLKGLLIEMKKRDIKRYPDLMIECSKMLLHFDKLINIYYTILYKKTK